MTRLRDRLRRARPAPAGTEEPRLPYGDQAGVRSFSINPRRVEPLGGTDVVVANPRPLRTVVDGRLVVLDRTTDACHVLNPSAGLILDAVDGHRTVDDLVVRLHDETGVPSEVLRPDVDRALTSFLAQGLVRLAGEDEPPAPPPPFSPGRPSPQDDPRVGRRRRWAPSVTRLLSRTVPPYTVGPVRLAGTSVVAHTADAGVAARLTEIFAPLPAATSAEHTAWLVEHGQDGPRRWRLVLDGEMRGALPEATAAVESLMVQLNLVVVAGSSGGVLLHAGAVEVDGRVVVIAGKSGRGKSTLTAALVQAGFAYLTDELVVLDPATRRVQPYPKALDLSAESQALLGVGGADAGVATKNRVAPDRLGTVSPGGDLALLVLLAPSQEVNDEPPTTTATRLTPVAALVELLQSTFAETFSIPEAMDVLGEMCELVPAVELPRMAVTDAVEAVRRALG